MTSLLRALVTDLWQGHRPVWRAPAFSALVVLTLAVGVGLTTSLFSAVYGLLLRPLPYPDPESIVVLQSVSSVGGRATGSGFSWTDLRDWSEQADAFETLALSGGNLFALDLGEGFESLRGWTVSEDFFPIFGDPLLIGRALPDPRAYEVVISHRLWQRHFGSDPAVLGRVVRLNAEPFTVVGVARPDFVALTDTRQTPGTAQHAPDVWTPIGTHQTAEGRAMRFYHVVGRLAPGVTLGEAATQARSLARTFAAAYEPDRSDVDIRLVSLPDHLREGVRRPLWILMGAVSLLLLVACTNVTTQIMARQATQGRDLVVRRALGASSRRLYQQSVGVSAWLAAGGGLLGASIAVGTLRLIRAQTALEIPVLTEVRIDGVVLTFTVVVSAVVAVASGLVAAAPLVRDRRPIQTTLQETIVVASRRMRGLRACLVAAQVAVSMVLLAGALLLATSFVRLVGTDLGVLADRVLSMQINLAMGRTLEEAERVALADRVVARVSAIPGVAAVGVANGLPPDQTRMRFRLEDTAETGGAPIIRVGTLLNPTPGYFAALGIPLLRGRLFTADDPRDPAGVAIVAATTARRLFGTLDVVGRPLPSRGEPQPVIVGVVGDVRYGGLVAPVTLTVYQPFAQVPFPHMNLVVRTDDAPDAVAASVRRAVHDVDRAITVGPARTLDELVSAAIAMPRVRTGLLGVFAALALFLAAIGLAAMTAFSVAARTREIAVRMALGADRAHVVTAVVWDGLVATATGVAVGTGAGLALSRTLDSLLHEVEPTNGTVFLTAVAVLVVVSLVAAYVPARRATRIQPMAALRAE